MFLKLSNFVQDSNYYSSEIVLSSLSVGLQLLCFALYSFPLILLPPRSKYFRIKVSAGLYSRTGNFSNTISEIWKNVFKKPFFCNTKNECTCHELDECFMLKRLLGASLTHPNSLVGDFIGCKKFAHRSNQCYCRVPSKGEFFSLENFRSFIIK